ncbi:MAG: hypothetical protein ABFD82_10540 [Syntrophaceae bacterium]
MEEKKEAKKLSMSSTKQEMLEAYNFLLTKLQEKREGELKPEKKLEEKKTNEAVRVAESLTVEGLAKEISNLKLDIGKMLSLITDRMEGEVNKFVAIRNAIAAKEKELQELYEIDKAAMTLAALIETQHEKRKEFESEMAKKKEELMSEIESTRSEWEKDQAEHEAAVKDRDAVEKKRQTREKEEFEYAFKKEQQQVKDRFEYEKAKLENDIKTKKEQAENELRVREAVVAEKEEELNDLRKRASLYPKELETTVNRAMKETSDRLISEANAKEELQKKGFEGERNVLNTRIEALEKTVTEQADRIAKLSQQLEAAYQKVQDIAIKTVEGSSSSKSLASLQQLLSEQTRRQQPEK